MIFKIANSYSYSISTSVGNTCECSIVETSFLFPFLKENPTSQAASFPGESSSVTGSHRNYQLPARHSTAGRTGGGERVTIVTFGHVT